MGDFERTFGAGADSVAIMDAFAASWDDEDHYEPEAPIDSGLDLPHPQSFFEMTGQVWHPGHDPRARLHTAQLRTIDWATREAVNALKENEEALKSADPRKMARLFLDHVSPGLDAIDPSLDAFETFIGQVVRACGVPVLFARDTGPEAGYVATTLSTHVVAFPGWFCLARFGGLGLQGPFHLKAPRSGYSGSPRVDFLRRFAVIEPGREVLEISAALRDERISINTVRDWIEAEKPDPSEVPEETSGFEIVADTAHDREPDARTWDDAAEGALRRRVRAIITCLAPKDATAEAFIQPSIWHPRVEFSVEREGMAWFQNPTHCLIQALLDRVDVSAFRGKSPPIKLFNEIPTSAHERMSDLTALRDTFAEMEIDVPAAMDALKRDDHAMLFQIISPEVFDAARRVDGSGDDTLKRYGLIEDDYRF